MRIPSGFIAEQFFAHIELEEYVDAAFLLSACKPDFRDEVRAWLLQSRGPAVYNEFMKEYKRG